jgi:hypothetical protein
VNGAGFTIYLYLFLGVVVTVVEPRSWRDVLDTTLCEKVRHWLAIGWWFFTCTPVSYTNKNYRYDITEILLKVILNTIVLTLISRHETPTNCFYIYITYHSSPQFRLCLTMNFKKENGRVILAIYVLVSCTLPSWICLSENDPQLCCFTDSWVTTVIRVGYIKTRFCARASV